MNIRGHLKALFTSKDGLLSVSKFWTNVGSATATYVVVSMAHAGTLSYEILLVYCTALVVPNLAQKMGYIMKKDE